MITDIKKFNKLEFNRKLNWKRLLINIIIRRNNQNLIKHIELSHIYNLYVKKLNQKMAKILYMQFICNFYI